MSLKVLLVGGGVTSALIGTLLKKSQLACHVTLWDKARGAGGRMSTSRSPGNPSCTADLGAQYITALPKYLQSHNDFYNSLLMSKVIEPLSSRIDGMKDFPEGTRHFVASGGMSSVVKHFISEGGLQASFGHHVSSIDLQADDRWLVRTKCGLEEIFDAVVLTMPVPQILQMPGDVADLIGKTEIKEKLQTVQYSSRYAFGLFYETALPSLDWDAKYLWDHDTFRFVSLDNRKRNKADQPTAVVFHTSIDFGRKHIDRNLEEVQPELLEKVKTLFPDWPEPSSVKCQKWRYSQVLQSYPEAPGSIVLSPSPLLVAAGDGFSHSNFDGCVESAVSATETLLAYITAKAL